MEEPTRHVSAALPRPARRPRHRDRDAVAEASEALRTMILTGEIAPGAELSQVRLAEMIGVSTTPLREALRRLEAEGLVESRRNRRSRVLPFDPADLDAVYCHRVLIESLSVSLTVPRLQSAQVEAQWGRLAELRRAADPRHWDAVHATFHAALVAGVNPPLRQDIARLMARSDRYRRMSVRSDDSAGRRVGDAEHEAILVACAAGEGQQAAGLLARHLTRSALTVLAHLAPDYDPAAVRGALQMVLSRTT
jgi:DNA-binding GntR family transcriptional regulator